MGDVGGICPQAKRRQPVGPIRVRGQSIGDIEELGLRQTNQGTAEKRAKRERVACVGERARQGNDTGSAWRKLKAAQVNWRLLLAIAELAGGSAWKQNASNRDVSKDTSTHISRPRPSVYGMPSNGSAKPSMTSMQSGAKARIGA